MKKFGANFHSPATICPYLADKLSTHENFFALDLGKEEVDQILAEGWRKFGAHFFRPQCESCKACIPLRVLTNEFQMTKEQRRILKKSEALSSHFHPLTYDPQLFYLYQKHSEAKFGNVPIQNENEFLEAFFVASAPSLGHSIFMEGKLIASGFLDIGTHSMSSVYFFYDPDYHRYSLGNLAILREIAKAKELGLPYYYLGYYIAENKHMNYKARFSPHQLYDWYNKSWEK